MNATAMGTSRSQTGTIFRRYLEVEARFADWARNQKLRLRHADASQVPSRLTQRLVALTCDHFTNDILTHGGIEACPVEYDLQAKTLNGVSFDTGIRSLRFAPSLLLRGVYEFLGHWMVILGAIVRGLLKGTTASTRISLFLDAPVDSPSKANSFAEFCREGPLLPLRTAERLVVQASFESRIGETITFTSSPIAYSLAHLVPRPLLLRFLAFHLLAPFAFLAALLRNRAICLLGHDAAYLPVVAAMDRADLIADFIVTLSFFRSQPLWLKGIDRQKSKAHMIWYSQNCVPKVYRDEAVDSDLPSIKHIRADCHWVWTEGFSAYLRNAGQSCRIEVVGPILFYMPGPPPSLPDGRKIVLFDIIPVKAANGVFGVAENYYSEAAIEKFVRDAVVATKELEAELGEKVWCLLKHKRAGRAAHHASQYDDFLLALEAEQDHFRIISHDVNLVGLLSSADASVAVPYTTTCAAASVLGKRSAYYDPFGTLLPRFERLPGVEFVTDSSSLKAFIRSAITARR